MRTRRILVVDATVGAAEALALLPDIDGFDVRCGATRRHPKLTIYLEIPTEALSAWPSDSDPPHPEHESFEG